jgi:hypothetical protein
MTTWSSSPDDWAHGASVPDPVWCPGEISRNEWLVRRELTQYPRSWRERYGEELVTTTIEVLDAEEFSGRRLPREVRADLRRGARAQWRRLRSHRFRTFWWQVAGGDARRIDRWYGRDLLLHPHWARRLVVEVGMTLGAVAGVMGVVALGYDFDAVFRLWSIVTALLLWPAVVLSDTRMMRKLRERRLASLGFSRGGVPVEWLPPPPEPPRTLPSP